MGTLGMLGARTRLGMLLRNLSVQDKRQTNTDVKLLLSPAPLRWLYWKTDILCNPIKLSLWSGAETHARLRALSGVVQQA